MSATAWLVVAVLATGPAFFGVLAWLGRPVGSGSAGACGSPSSTGRGARTARPGPDPRVEVSAMAQGKPSTGTPKDKRLKSNPGGRKPGPKPGGGKRK